MIKTFATLIPALALAAAVSATPVSAKTVIIKKSGHHHGMTHHHGGKKVIIKKHEG